METQAAVAEPQEAGTILVHSSTQSIDGVQSAVARALGVPAHNVVAGAPAPSRPSEARRRPVSLSVNPLASAFSACFWIGALKNKSSNIVFPVL